MSEKTINYHCTEGNSDKVYRLSLVAEGDGFLVTTQYGPRGGRQTVGQSVTRSVTATVAECSGMTATCLWAQAG